MRRDNSNYSYEIKEIIVEFIWCGNPFRFLWMQRIPIKEETEQIKSVVTFWLYSGGENYASHCSVCVLVFFQCVCICCASVCFKVWRARMDPFIFHRAYIIQKPSLYSTPIFSRVASLAFVSCYVSCLPLQATVLCPQGADEPFTMHLFRSTQEQQHCSWKQHQKLQHSFKITA